MVYDYAIIGEGISRIAIARLLQMSGVRSFIILEANGESGGLCRSRTVDGHALDIGGGHFERIESDGCITEAMPLAQRLGHNGWKAACCAA